VEQNETLWWRMVGAWRRLPGPLQEALADLAVALVEALEKVESPGAPIPVEA